MKQFNQTEIDKIVTITKTKNINAEQYKIKTKASSKKIIFLLYI